MSHVPDALAHLLPSLHSMLHEEHLRSQPALILHQHPAPDHHDLTVLPYIVTSMHEPKT